MTTPEPQNTQVQQSITPPPIIQVPTQNLAQNPVQFINSGGRKIMWIVAIGAIIVAVGAFSFYAWYPFNKNVENTLTASTTPEGKDIGFIYSREAKISDESQPSDEFVLFNISKQSVTKIDMSRPFEWQGVGDKPVILYTREEIAGESNAFVVSAFDLTSSVARSIKLPDEVNAYSSIAYSPVEKKVAYCAADETVFAVLDLASGRKDTFPSFTGCLANSSFNPPHFSSDGTEVYYQTFGSNEDGTYNQSFYKYQKLSIATGESTVMPIEMDPTNERFDPNRKWLAYIATAGNDVESFNNQLVIFDLSMVPQKSATDVVRAQTAPSIVQKTLGTYVHIGDIQRTDDGSGFFFYTYVQKGSDSGANDFQIGFFDSDSKTVIYPIGSIPSGYGRLSLLGSHGKEFVVFSLGNNSTQLDDVYYASVPTSTVKLVDRSTGLLTAGQVYFVEQK